MSDRYLRTLLRQAQQGQVALTDYIAAALRVSSPEAVIADLQGFSVDDIRLAVRLVWIPVYAAESKETNARAALAIALEAGETDFPARDFFERNQALLSDKDWRLFAADCAERALHPFESKYPDDTRPRKAIETARRFSRGEVTERQLAATESAAWSAADAARSAAEDAAEDAARAASWAAADYAAKSAAWSAAGYAAESAAGYATWYATRSAARSAERAWQAARLSDYLVGISSLPPPPT